MKSSTEKIAANRENSKKSTGPKNTARTKHNALLHGLCAAGLTELDDPERCRKILAGLRHEKSPCGLVEEVLVELITVELSKLFRVRRLEAEYVAGVLHPPRYEKDPFGDLDAQLRGSIVDPGTPAEFAVGNVQYLVAPYDRYASSIANRLYRAIHELEREQRMRKGENLPAPAAVDRTVLSANATVDSAPAAQELPASANVSDTETVSAPIPARSGGAFPPVKAEQQRVPPAEGQNSAAQVADRSSEKLAPTPEWSPTTRSLPIWSKR